jgi:hypothetical protein
LNCDCGIVLPIDSVVEFEKALCDILDLRLSGFLPITGVALDSLARPKLMLRDCDAFSDALLPPPSCWPLAKNFLCLFLAR